MNAVYLLIDASRYATKKSEALFRQITNHLDYLIIDGEFGSNVK